MKIIFISVIMRRKLLQHVETYFHDIVLLLISQKATNILRHASYFHYLQTVKFNVNLWTLCFVLQKSFKTWKDWVIFRELSAESGVVGSSELHRCYFTYTFWVIQMPSRALLLVRSVQKQKLGKKIKALWLNSQLLLPL